MLSSCLKRFAKEAVGPKAIPGVARIILAASCKGGVGKSTVAMNTAISLAQTGAKVGLFDGDIYGPSVPTMAKTTSEYLLSDKDANFIPVEAHGIETVSLGNCVEKEKPLMWKGPLVGQVLADLVRKAAWGNLDYLVVDTPPGTGDVHMCLAQQFPIDGALIVTTPQMISVADVARSLDAFEKLKVPILGLVENFASFVCDGCKTKTKIFEGDGAELLSKKFNVPVLGSLPIDPAISGAADNGIPAVISQPNSEYAKVFQEIAETIISLLPKMQNKEPKTAI